MNPLPADDAGRAAVPVDPALAHKRLESNLWLTSHQVGGGTEMDASFTLPLAVCPPRLPALMEVWRQAGLVFAHRVLCVPMDHVFSLTSISLSMGERRSWHGISRRGVLRITDCVVSVKRSIVRSAAASVTMRMESGHLLKGRLSARFLPTSIYARLRSASPMLQTEDGPSKPPSRRAAQSRKATTPPSFIDPFYDHEHDHVTAMSLVSAIEHSIAESARASLSGLELEFQSYIDTSPLPEIFRTDMSDRQFRGAVVQDGCEKAHFSASLGHTSLPGLVDASGDTSSTT